MLVSSGTTILPELGEKLGTYAQQKLVEQKVDIRLSCKVKAKNVTLSGTTMMTTNTTCVDGRHQPTRCAEYTPMRKT